MTAKLAFIDTETTGLDPDRHEIWEVGLIVRHEDGTEEEHQWQLPVDLGKADSIALNIGGFHDRRWSVYDDDRYLAASAEEEKAYESKRARILGAEEPAIVPSGWMRDWAEGFVSLTRGAHLVGAVVSFDAERLSRLLRRLGQCPMWHYHLVDVEGLAAGYLAGRHRGLSPEGPTDDRAALAAPPWKSEDLSRAVGIDPEQFDRHTALGDARWAKAIYDAVIPVDAP